MHVAVTGIDHALPRLNPGGERRVRDEARGEVTKKHDVMAWRATTIHTLTYTGLPLIVTKQANTRTTGRDKREGKGK